MLQCGRPHAAVEQHAGLQGRFMPNEQIKKKNYTKCYAFQRNLAH